MKILIIGSKGFIGSHCVEYFGKLHDVWQCDIVVDYTTPNYLLLDTTTTDYDEIFSTIKFDVCINCSGAASVPDSLQHPQRDFNLNTYTIFKQLEAIRSHQSECKYLHISSAAVYGNPTHLPISESHSLSPISPYGNHKKMAEEIVHEFHTYFGIQACSIRVFSAYGPGLKKQLFWDLYQKYKTTHKIELFGSGKESRDFIYITDLVKAIDVIINDTSSFNGQEINVANGEELTIEKVAAIFYNHLDPNVEITFMRTQRNGDPNNWAADISKLKELGYNKKVNIKEGLLNYIAWLKANEL